MTSDWKVKLIVLCFWQVSVTPPFVPTLGQWSPSGCHTAGHPQGGTTPDRNQLWGQCEASQQHDPGQAPRKPLSPPLPTFPIKHSSVSTLSVSHFKALGTVLLAKNISKFGLCNGCSYFVGVLKMGG